MSKITVGWVDARKPNASQIIQNVGFRYRSTQPTIDKFYK